MKEWISIGIKVVPLVWGAVQAVERMVSARGRDKEDAAVDMVNTFVEATEGAYGRDVVNNERVKSATRKLMQAVVEFQNVVREVATNLKPA